MNDPHFWPIRLNIPTQNTPTLPKNNVAVAPQEYQEEVYREMNDYRSNVKKELAIKR